MKTSSKNNPSARFVATREHHLLETAEDYTELIAELIEEQGEARVCDLAKSLGVSHVTTLRTLKRLQRDGYIKTSPHQPIILTPKGKRLANFAKNRHEIILKFLIKMGVPEEVAVIDVEGIEHHVSKKTLEVFKKHL